MRENDNDMEARKELLELVSALKNHIVSSEEPKGCRNILYMKSDTQRGSESKVGVQGERETGAVYSKARRLEDIREELGDCRRCDLYRTRKNLVFGEGSPEAELVFVGEAPGESEDIQGKPFVGRAGQLLTRIIEAMGLKRSDVYICNILKCRPPGNRNPRPEEIQICEPFLIKQLQAIRPTVICAMGTFAAKTLLQTEMPISKLRGRFHTYQGIELMPTYHPAYLLRNPGGKKQVWSDMQMIMEHLGKK
ncbi:MAG: uracil-DNA glycosylase [Thermodesulfobacteriota bacterium]|nr:uracil-DNA glycosylase [Thermodesulfobacteriota bacterium]